MTKYYHTADEIYKMFWIHFDRPEFQLNNYHHYWYMGVVPYTTSKEDLYEEIKTREVHEGLSLLMIPSDSTQINKAYKVSFGNVGFIRSAEASDAEGPSYITFYKCK